MMYDNMTICEVLGQIDESTKVKVQKYLDSKKVHSVKIFNEGDRLIVEAFIVEQKEIIYLPYLELDEDELITDSHCQCCDDGEPCVHKLALLLAAQVMLETEDYDYHMALKRKTAQLLEGILSI